MFGDTSITLLLSIFNNLTVFNAWIVKYGQGKWTQICSALFNNKMLKNDSVLIFNVCWYWNWIFNINWQFLTSLTILQFLALFNNTSTKTTYFEYSMAVFNISDNIKNFGHYLTLLAFINIFHILENLHHLLALLNNWGIL